MKSNLVDVEVQVHAKTDKAVLVSDDGDRDEAVWVPLSQCELVQLKGTLYTLTCEQWLAEDKGLV